MKSKILAIVLAVSAAPTVYAATGCTPVQSAVLSRIEQTVLDDLASGKTAVQIETDVAALLAGQSGADVVAIVNDVIALLIDLGVIPPGIIPQATAVRAELKAKLAARPAVDGGVK